MTALPKIDMNEATRLTRLGRLSEAMAILRGQGRAPANDVDASADQDVRGVLDMAPPTKPGGAWTAPAVPREAATVLPAVGQHEIMKGGVRPPRAPKLGKILGTQPTARSAPIARGAQFEQRTYSNGSGSRAYKLYMPSRYRGQPLPLVVMLHGCTQSPDDFAAGTRMNEIAEEQDFFVAYPAQPQSANASKCWNWFNVGDQGRDQGEPSLIAGITRQIMADFAIEKDRVYVAGLSAGGAAAAIMGTTYPDLYAAIGVHSGLACGAARDMPSAFSAMSQGGPASFTDGQSCTVPTIVFHGDKDRTVSPVNGDRVIAQSKAGRRLRTSMSRGHSSGGVAYQRTVYADDTEISVLEKWDLYGAGHAWSGGSASGTYTYPQGPDASREMVRFFLEHRLRSRQAPA